MRHKVRISSDLWEALLEISAYWDDELHVIMTEPYAPEYVDRYGFEIGPDEYYRHDWYFRTHQRSAAFASLVIGVAFLEAYINELIAVLPAVSPTLRSSLRRLPLTAKYERLFRHLGEEPSSAPAAVLGAFHLLVRIRNDIVHFSPIPPKQEALAKTLELLRTRIKVESNSTGYPTCLAGPEFMKWILETVKNMLRYTNQLAGHPELCLDPDLPSYYSASEW